jgi:GNAT superfamily N-acetyltransferase
MTAPGVFRIDRGRQAEAGDVLWDAFHDYPTTRYIIGGTGDDYDRGLRALGGFFVTARFLRDEPVLAVADGEALVAVATVTLPGERPSPPELASMRDQVWRELGAEALKRYEAFGRACEAFVVEEPHHHLNMIGVRRSYAGRGLARPLLEAVHALSREDPGSRGVTLTTEDPRNVPLYRHFGYEIIGHARVTDALETWGFFRPDG